MDSVSFATQLVITLKSVHCYFHVLELHHICRASLKTLCSIAFSSVWLFERKNALLQYCVAVCALSKHFNSVAALDWKSMLEQIDVWWIVIANNQKKTDLSCFRVLLYSAIRANPYSYLWLPLLYMECILSLSFTNSPCPYLTITQVIRASVRLSVPVRMCVCVFVMACGGDVQKSFWLSMTWML